MELNEKQKSIAGEIIEDAKAGQPGSIIFGEPQVGKTTLLDHLENFFKEEEKPRFKFIIRFSTHEIIGDTMKDTLVFLAKRFGVTYEPEDFTQFFNERSNEVLLIIDEYQDLNKRAALYLRAMSQAHHLTRIAATKDKSKNTYSCNDMSKFKLER